MRVLLAEDDKSVRRVLQFKLEKSGYDVTAVDDGEQALKKLKADTYDLLLSDIKMPKVDGIELLEHARGLQPDLKVILITAHATVSQAVQAVKLGAFDYITKPFEDEELFVAIEKALSYKRLEQENRSLKGRLKQSEGRKGLIGVSRAFKDMLAVVEKIAATDATVLLAGDSGTGKELVARTIHNKSARSDREFVAVNCAAIPKELIESELFGHIKGAFTGAVKDKRGKFEIADGGTIFLDEVGELATDLQAKLLRALQERVIEPVGSEKPRQVDVRVIAATNVNLEARVSEGKFREDLFYRLNVIPITIPALRDRRDDIPVLAKEFVRRFAPGTDIKVSHDLLHRLQQYDWPGNIRELENLVERMVILRQSDTLSVDDLPDDFGKRAAPATEQAPLNSSTPSDTASEPVSFHEAEEKLVRDALEKCGWNRTKAAEYLDIPRHVLIYRIKKYDIEPG